LLPECVVFGELLDGAEGAGVEVGALEEAGEKRVGVKEGADDFNGGVSVAEVFDDFVVPFEEFLAAQGAVGAGGAFDVVEEDEGGPPLAVGNAAEFSAGGVDLDLDVVDVDAFFGPFALSVEFLVVDFPESVVCFEFGLDVMKVAETMMM